MGDQDQTEQVEVEQRTSRRRGAAAARARADAQRAVRARTKALADVADRWAATDERLERAASKRDETIDRARQRAIDRYDKEVAHIEAGRQELIREALGLEGATTREVATWLGVSNRKVNLWRAQLEEDQGQEKPDATAEATA
ncbi:hypothetical protein [Actinomyces naeslundii]|uniref:hypothetical protein n=1 Tax=Actinomyces naeslundii TaxID=1655 RepID=UPI001177A013|nr:hypothetical protein [Actinomyces naeslundii]